MQLLTLLAKLPITEWSYYNDFLHHPVERKYFRAAQTSQTSSSKEVYMFTACYVTICRANERFVPSEVQNYLSVTVYFKFLPKIMGRQ